MVGCLGVWEIFFLGGWTSLSEKYFGQRYLRPSPQKKMARKMENSSTASEKKLLV